MRPPSTSASPLVWNQGTSPVEFVPSRSVNVYDHEMELSLGETVKCGEFYVTVLEIDGDEVHLKVVEGDAECSGMEQREFVLSLPR